MKSRHTLLLACLFSLSSSAWTQGQRSPMDDRIQTTFRAVDLDKNGTINPREAAKAGIKARSFAVHDKNKDRRLASDEFSTYYTQLIEKSRAERAKRLKAEEDRKKREAEAKAKQTKEAQKVADSKGAGAKGAKPVGSQPAAGQPSANPADRVAQGTVPQQKKPNAASTAVVDLSPGSAANRNQPAAQKPTAAKPIQDQPAPAQANAKTQKPVKAKGKNTPQDPGSVIKPGSGKTDAQLLQAEQEARGYVQRILSQKHISAQEARDMYQSLSVGARGQSGTIGLTEWRTALNNSKARVTALVRSGALTAPEGRAMYELFEERARRAVQAMTPPAPSNAADTADLDALTPEQLQKLIHDAERIQNAREATRLQNYRNAKRTADARERLRLAEEEKNRINKERARAEALQNGKQGAKTTNGANRKPVGASKVQKKPSQGKPVGANSGAASTAKPGAQPGVKPVAKPAGQPVEKPVGKPVAQPAGKAAQRSQGKGAPAKPQSAQQAKEAAIQRARDEARSKPAAKKPSGNSNAANKPAGKQSASGKPAVERAGKPAKTPAATPKRKPAEKPTNGPAGTTSGSSSESAPAGR